MQRGTVTFFFLVAGLLLIAVLIVFYLGILRRIIPLESPVKPSMTSISRENNQLSTYNSYQLGLEFQYTSSLIVKEDPEEEFNKRGNGDFRKNFQDYVGYQPGSLSGAVVVLEKDNNYNTNPFTVWVFDNPNGLTTENWFNNYWYYPFLWGVFDYTSKSHITPDSEATVSGRPAKYKTVSYQEGQPKYVYVAKDQKMYLFRVMGDNGEKILSTAKLLNKTNAEGQPCGGFSGETGEWACPEGYRCKYPKPMYPDAQGQCVKL